MTDKTVTIIGSGNFGRAFATRLTLNGYRVTFGSRDPSKSKSLINLGGELLADISVVDIATSLRQSQVIIMAVPNESLEEVVKGVNLDLLDHKIIIDVTNPTKDNSEYNAAKLATILPNSHVIKAFSTISAYSLESDVAGEKRQVYVSGNDRNAVDLVVQLAESIGFSAIRQGSLEAGQALEKTSHQVFVQWQKPLLVAAIILFLWFTYAVIRFYFIKSPPFKWDNLPLFVFNKVVACTAITILAIIFLPNSLAAFLQLHRGTKYIPFPLWLDAWLRIRRELGLIVLWLGVLHAVMSLLIYNAAYFKKQFEVSSISVSKILNSSEKSEIPVDSKLNWNGELFVVFGCFALGSLALLGVSSLPSVQSTFNWREFRCCFSNIGFLALVFASAHLTIFGSFGWLRERYIGDVLMSMSFISSILPWFTIAFRLLLVLPCLSRPLTRIRRGETIKQQSKSSAVENGENGLKMAETNVLTSAENGEADASLTKDQDAV